MNAHGSSYRIYLILALIALAGEPALGKAQASAGASQQHSTSEQSRETDSGGRQDPKPDSGTQTEIGQMRAKLDQMQAVLERQQRAIAELERRTDACGTQAQAASLNVAPASEPTTPIMQQSGVVSITGVAARAANLSSPSTSDQSKPEDKPSPLAGWDRDRGRAFLRSADGSFETSVTGYAQLDYHGYQSGNLPPQTFLVRRARVIVEGQLGRYFDYRIEGDFSDGTSTILRDFYVRVHRFDELQLTFGQVRVPISQEEIRQDAVQDFVERSLVNGLVPSRSPGMMASGRTC